MIPSTTAFDARVHLAWGDVAVDDATPPSSIRVHLKRSKCDQLGKGVDVFVGKSGDRSCPVAATLLYVRIRGPAVGPFFVREDGVPLTKAAFVGKVRSALTTLGVASNDYAGHSFRIGAATAASLAGLEDSVIQSLGRWNSAAFRRYIRAPREQLAGYSRALAGGAPPPSPQQPVAIQHPARPL